jgi:hypothetical protein
MLLKIVRSLGRLYLRIAEIYLILVEDYFRYKHKDVLVGEQGDKDISANP